MSVLPVNVVTSWKMTCQFDTSDYVENDYNWVCRTASEGVPNSCLCHAEICKKVMKDIKRNVEA